MDSTISYVNNRGEFKIAIVPEEIESDLIKFDEVTEMYTYLHPISGDLCALHSLADRPCLLENYNRRHWMWRGKLHRLTGPAFVCDGNSEWYAFGIMLHKDVFEKHKEYLLRLEAFANANGIDLHGATTKPEKASRYFLTFADENHLIDCAESNMIPLCDRDTGDLRAYYLDELNAELKAEERSPSLLVTAVLGAAAAFAAAKIKQRVEAASVKEVQQAQTASHR